MQLEAAFPLVGCPSSSGLKSILLNFDNMDSCNDADLPSNGVFFYLFPFLSAFFNITRTKNTLLVLPDKRVHSLEIGGVLPGWLELCFALLLLQGLQRG